MMLQLQRLGNVQQNEDLQPIARELNHHIQQSGMEYMRKMSWIAERLRRQTILFASNNQDSFLLDQSLLQDKENWVADNQTSKEPSPSRILQQTKLRQESQRDKGIEPFITAKVTSSHQKPTKGQLETANSYDHFSSSSSPSHQHTPKSIPQSEKFVESSHSNKDIVSQNKASKESNTNIVTEENPQTTKTEEQEMSMSSVQEEPVFQSVKDRIQRFSDTIHEQDREKQLEQYTKATLLSKRSKERTDNLNNASTPERQISRVFSSNTAEEHKEENQANKESLGTLLETSENPAKTEYDRKPELKKPDKLSRQTEPKRQSQGRHSSSERSFSASVQGESIRRKSIQEETKENAHTLSSRKTAASGKSQLWTNLPPLPVENWEKVKETKQVESSIQEKFPFRSKSNKSHKPKNKEVPNKMKKDDVTSLFSAFKHGWSKIAKPHDLQLFKKSSPSTASVDKEAVPSSTFRSNRLAMNNTDSLETSFPQSDLSRIHEPAVPLYPIQDRITSLQPTAPILSNSILSQEATSSANQDNNHWIDCQTTDGRHFRWNMCTQQVEWSE
ncbi:hypothetical protein Gasu_17810 isoform 2 [Galdieria sulphuraria]|nr:hypothetical protein Gasu_17810 isoform 2 [Galdieria sulphuraria]EME31021.1 hypothetical protein Gasu_17810 isoform 2 [Galdieria sulphuraria]|eukprot:XP_005707541.1 hypothetical protein isoform 2 [Galdieria sulphuraria]